MSVYIHWSVKKIHTKILLSFLQMDKDECNNMNVKTWIREPGIITIILLIIMLVCLQFLNLRNVHVLQIYILKSFVNVIDDDHDC